MGKALSFFVNRELSRGWLGWQASWVERLESSNRSDVAWPSF